MKLFHTIYSGRKTLSLLLCLVLLFSLLPGAVFAVENGGSGTPVPTASGTDLLSKFQAYEVTAEDPIHPVKDPELVTVNLFDYWLDTRGADDFVDVDAEDNAAGKDLYNGGINKDHKLKFVHNADATDDINKFYPGTPAPTDLFPANGGPRMGIVQNNLGTDGYPKLAVAHDTNQESLAYLFNAEEGDAMGKAAYMDVKGLFQLDPEGYFYYNSAFESTKDAPDGNDYQDLFADAYHSANYAFYDEADNRFRLYNSWGGWLSSLGGIHGQFFPFDAPDKVFRTDANGAPVLTSGKLDPCNTPDNAASPASWSPASCGTNTFNHYIGLSMEIPFIQTPDGLVPGTDPTAAANEANHTKFYFSGDDDMWLFIDGVLVGDLGGIHNAAILEIDFTDGEVTLMGGHHDSSGTVKDKITLHLDTLFQKAGQYNANNFDGHTFKDGTKHVIKMFYMERGNNASNLGIKFNLQPIPASSLKKVDQNGMPIAGAEFAIYKASKNTETKEYTIADDTPVYTGKTDDKGIMTVLDKDGFPLLFTELEGDYFILKETKVPAGYRSEGDIHLVKHTFEDGSVTLVSDPESPTGSKWSTGSYAAAQELTLVDSKDIYLRDDTQIVNENKFVPGYEGTMFAVVMKWVGDGPATLTRPDLNDHWNWRPVYGDAHDGYHIAEVAGTTEEAYNAAILTAIQANPYVFRIGSTGLYEVLIDHMPGNILHYLHARTTSNAEQYPIHYSIFYGWTNAASIEQATASDQFQRLDSDDFKRTFSADFIALNTKDVLNVEKTDEYGNPVADAEFSLYKADNTELDATTGERKAKAGATAYDKGETDADGKLSFPTGNKVLEAGEYYLEETRAPEGYRRNPQRIHVIVDNTGVYADAGTADDGVTVRRGVGNLVDTMHEFGVNNDLDETLYNIKYTPQAGTVGTGGFEWASNGSSVHMHHNHNPHGYVVTESGASSTYTTDEGWARLLIQQCFEHEQANPNAYKENLGERDITNLFTREVTVIVENDTIDASIALEGHKTLNGRTLSAEEFEFTLEALAAPGSTAAVPMPASATAKNSADGAIRFGTILYKEAGTYQYKITEVKGDAAGVTYDESYWIATVTVTGSSSDELTATAAYEHFDKDGNSLGTDTAAKFVNDAPELPGIVIPEKPTDGFSFTISKRVVGTGKDLDKRFAFTLRLSDANVNGVYSGLYFQDGAATFTLAHGESISISGLPQGASYTVEEDVYEGYTPYTQNASGVIGSGSVHVVFENVADHEVKVPTTGGRISLFAGFAVLLLSGISLGAALVLQPKRRSR